MNIKRYTTEQEVTDAARIQLHTLLVQHAARPTLLLLSGGSALRILDDSDLSQCSADLIVTMLDERFSTDPDVNNFAQLTKTEFYSAAKEYGAHFIDTRPAEGEDIDALAKRLNTMLATVFAAHKDLVVIATMGIGDDGHTAGIMPYPDDAEFFAETFVDTTKYYVSYDAGTKNQFPLRVTATTAFLTEKVDHAIVYAAAQEKRAALNNVDQTAGELHVTPARVIRDMKDGTIFTDIQNS